MVNSSPIVVISGAIGSGKGTIVHALVSELGLAWVLTHTTRPRRNDDDVVSRRVFDNEITFLRHLERGEIITPAKISGHYYGLLKSDLESALRQERAVILELTAEGGVELAKNYPDCLLFFITAEAKTLEARIGHREMAAKELSARQREGKKELALAKGHYDYIIENIHGHPEEAIETIEEIILERFPALRQSGVEGRFWL